MSIVVAIACLLLSVASCDQSEQAIEMNIKQLREASDKLEKNPADKAALALLVNQLSDRRDIYRVNAAAVLGETARRVAGPISAEAVPALSSLLERGDNFDKKAAASALAKFGPYAKDAWPVLRKNLFPVDRDIAWYSAEALGNIGEPAAAALPDLMKALRENISQCDGYFSSFCSSFIPAIGKMRGSAAGLERELEGMLSHRDPNVRMRLAGALIRINPGNASALQEIEKLLHNSDADVRRHTLVVLRELGKDAQPARHLIVAATKDQDEDVRETAVSAIKVLNN
jgi:HEAT repeat protein